METQNKTTASINETNDTCEATTPSEAIAPLVASTPKEIPLVRKNIIDGTFVSLFLVTIYSFDSTLLVREYFNKFGLNLTSIHIDLHTILMSGLLMFEEYPIYLMISIVLYIALMVMCGKFINFTVNYEFNEYKLNLEILKNGFVMFIKFIIPISVLVGFLFMSSCSVPRMSAKQMIDRNLSNSFYQYSDVVIELSDGIKMPDIEISESCKEKDKRVISKMLSLSSDIYYIILFNMCEQSYVRDNYKILPVKKESVNKMIIMPVKFIDSSISAKIKSWWLRF